MLAGEQRDYIKVAIAARTSTSTLYPAVNGLALDTEVVGQPLDIELQDFS